jgi:hypothetical protein
MSGPRRSFEAVSDEETKKKNEQVEVSGFLTDQDSVTDIF